MIILPRTYATVPIISGVEDGDQVVITGQSRLTNGMEVEIENE